MINRHSSCRRIKNSCNRYCFIFRSFLMKPLVKFAGAALLVAFTLLAAPNAQAQVRVNVNIGAPGWGPQVPYGTQYYYIPEIDGYYDLYAQQYLVYDDGYWVTVPELYGYDPYQFHPVAIAYRGREPWCQRDYYHQRYAYQPYRAYPRGGYYTNGYGRAGYPGGGYYGGNRGYYGNGGRGHNDHDRDDRGRGYDHDRDYPHRTPDSYGGGGYNGPRGGQGQYPGNGGYGSNPRDGQPQSPQPQQPGGYGNDHGGDQRGNNQGQGNNQGGGRHGRD